MMSQSQFKRVRQGLVLCLCFVCFTSVFLFAESLLSRDDNGRSSEVGSADSNLIANISSFEVPILLDRHGLSSWAFPHGCVAGLQVLKSVVSGSDSPNSEVVELLAGAYTVDQVKGVLSKARDFELLLQSGDADLVWAVLLKRSNKEAAFLDLLILGEIFWGSKFSCLPDNTDVVINLDDEPFSYSSWSLPAGTGPQWESLYEGTNKAYRLLAVEAVSRWGDEEKKTGFIQNGWEQESHAVRRVWFREVQNLPLHTREDLLSKALAKAQQTSDEGLPLSEEQQELVSQLSDYLDRARSGLVRERKAEEMKERAGPGL